MKKIILIFLILFCISCGKPNSSAMISLNDNLIFEYNEIVYLKDIVDIKGGKYNNNKIDTLSLGNKEYKVSYKDKNGYEYDYTIKYKIIDSTPPVLFANKAYTTTIGKDIDLIGKITCGDNYDRNLKCEVIGQYDINKTGTYNLKFKATDNSNNITEKEFTLNIVDKIQQTNSTSTSYPIQDLIKKHKNDKTMIGIDVSTWQGDINWQEVKNSGVEFAIIRIGFGHVVDKGMVMDNKYIQNIKGAKENGIKVGLYFFSYATTKNEIKEQTDWIIKTLDGEALDLPIAFDWENWHKFYSYKMNFKDINDLATYFMDIIKENGYEGMLYGSANYMTHIWNNTKYPNWLAHYTDQTTYKKDYYIWQCSSTGSVPGIKGNVDLDILYFNK